MRACNFFVFVVSALMSFGGGVFDQWVETNGPVTGGVNGLIVGDSSLQVWTTSGLYLTTDGGNLWSHAGVGSGSPPVTAIAQTGSSILAATPTDGIYKSTDNGVTWAKSSSGLPSDLSGNIRVAQVVALDSIVVAWTTGGVFVSTDDGATWNSSSVLYPPAPDCVLVNN